jgi:hypothetical protein
MGIKVIRNLQSDELKMLVKNSTSFCNILVKLGLHTKTFYINELKNKINEYNIDISQMKINYKNLRKKLCVIPLNKILVTNSNYSRVHLKTRLISNNFLPYICAECGNVGDWNGKPLILQIDHINGVNNDNRLENLRLLCPNCHSQTENFAGKKKK